MSLDTPAIAVEGLSRSFGSVRAVNDLTFSTPRGVVFGFLGPNGAGKTTTIMLLLGLLAPDAGECRVLGYDVRSDADAIRQRCGALLEHSGLYERLTAEDNLKFMARVAGLTGVERDNRVRELLEQMGLWDRRRDMVRDWSRGMKQKLAVARALVGRPQLVFLDEPTAGLDPVAAAAFRQDIAGLAALQGVTVFLTTHNLAEAEQLCSLVAVIRSGSLMAYGAPSELRQRSGKQTLTVIAQQVTDTLIERLEQLPDVLSVSRTLDGLDLQMPPGVSAAGVVQLMVEGGARIEEVRRGSASLERVFLDLMRDEHAA